ncbi:hypothetical protein [Bosea sp. AS-1]|uniref:hypothetical protein n=1 Tax=Bosea sp. AS-1 TaxID=2015316 RepID=UPI000B791872|nr:hypothetical protein [Bosea sp. AS-1]
MAEKLTREQAEAFLATLWPCGHMAHLDNPTRTFFAALIGRVPQGIPYEDHPYNGADDMAKLRTMAEIMRQIASHIETPGQEAVP